MKILVVGATGKTGREVMTQALSQGHSVVALARRPEAITLQHARLAVVKGDVLDATSLGPACDGVDAVISALGIGASRAPTRVYSDGIRHILTAMQAAGTGRIVVVSAEPAGPWAPHTLLRRVVLFPILQRLFGATYDDMRRMETILRDSPAQWTVLRPPRLLDKPARKAYRLNPDGPLTKGPTLTYADLATALIDVLGQSNLTRQAVAVAN